VEDGPRAAENRSKDILGRVYEYFLTQFASAEGKNGGQFYTPRCVVRMLVEMLAPYKGRVYDPCCGSAGMFVQSEKFVEEHAGLRYLAFCRSVSDCQTFIAQISKANARPEIYRKPQLGEGTN
jgi:type I restriction-modification system DNA methylase subunit